MSAVDQPEFVQQLTAYAGQAWEIAEGWLFSPAAWSQFGLLVVAYLLALFLTRRFKPLLSKLLYFVLCCDVCYVSEMAYTSLTPGTPMTQPE